LCQPKISKQLTKWLKKNDPGRAELTDYRHAAEMLAYHNRRRSMNGYEIRNFEQFGFAVTV
jgi:hypothetical protein